MATEEYCCIQVDREGKVVGVRCGDQEIEDHEKIPDGYAVVGGILVLKQVRDPSYQSLGAAGTARVCYLLPDGRIKCI